MARVLVAGDSFDDSFAENVTVTLKGMGHEVAGAPHRPISQSLTRRVQKSLVAFRGRIANKPNAEDVALLRAVRAFRPDILLALTRNVHPEVLQGVRTSTGSFRVLWWADAPANATGWGLANPEWDAIYSKDIDAVNKLRLIRREAHLLHEAMNPRWHRVESTRTSDDILVIGNYYGFRQALTIELMKSGVNIAAYGPRPPRWAHPSILSLWRATYLTKLEKSRAIGSSLAVLNSFAFAEGNSLNCRAFEVAGAGGLQLLEHRSMVSDCFEPEKEILTFRTFDELMERIQWSRAEDAGTRRIRAAAARRALAEHTYEHRLRAILNNAGLTSRAF